MLPGLAWSAPDESTAQDATRRLIEVALPLPLFRTFTYIVEGPLAERVAPGWRVLVPFRNRREIGICVGDAAVADPERTYKPVLEVPDTSPAIGAGMLALCRWGAEYYVAPIGLMLRAALPVLMTGAATPTPSRKMHRVATLSRELPSLLERDRLFPRAKRQRDLFELLESLGGRSPVEHLTDRLKFSPSVLAALVKAGLVAIEQEPVDRDPFAARPAAPPHTFTPTDAQRQAIDAISGAAPGEVFLLHGITGSGKTLVYIDVLRRVVLERGRSAIVLVPEIALTPQTVDRFRSVFGDQVAVLHSALSDGERYDAWLALERGERRIAVGARSAIFAPLSNVGAIIVDEEHETTYKQAEAPRYHARELAIVRARGEGAVVVLGSATPSLESWVNATQGKYRLLQLPERVGGGSLPVVEVVDLRVGRDKPRDPAADPVRAVLSAPLEEALGERLARGEQSILLLNRRGFASFVQCGSCGDVVTCPNCSISLTYHKAPERLICHYCLHEEAPREQCVVCGGSTLRRRGLGTQQVERLIADRFPAARLARMDVDTTSGKWAHADILDRVGRAEVDVLLGTQMIAKGLDFPNVTLVGVIDADVGINLPDFRASERCFQLLSQVAGRAGRGPKGGRVIIQTRVPRHHAVRYALAHDYESFVREELAGRRTPPYPPLSRLANVVFSGINESAVADLAMRGAEWLRALASDKGVQLSVVGAAPCPVERVNTRWRWHVLLRGTESGALGRMARYFMTHFDVPSGMAQLRVMVDRDPVTLL